MKTIALVKTMTLLLSLAMPSTCNNPTNHTDIMGDYLFDYKDQNLVIYISVYQDNNELYAFSEFADYPVKMETIDEKNHSYRITYQNSMCFDMIFNKKDNNATNNLKLKSCSSNFELTGIKVNPTNKGLQAYHKRKNQYYTYKAPLKIDGDWEVSTIQKAGIDTLAIYKAMNNLLAKNDYLQSILIVKDGKLVLEEYFNRCDPLRIHRVQSVTKTVTSTLTGLAIENGFIKSIDDPIYKYLPEYESLFDNSKKKITIAHLLTMSAGFEWNEEATYYDNPKKCDSHLAESSGDYIKYVLSKPLANEPGEAYSYNSGFPNILGYIIEKESGMNITEFAYKYLFNPLGIERSYWISITGENKPSCAGGLRLISRDMAKYGELYLKEGLWKGNRIIGKEWVKSSIKEQIITSRNTGYGYFWKRIQSLDGKHVIHYASGTGGQYIAFVPDLDITVVTTAKPFTNKIDAVAMFLLKEIIPALN